MKVGVQARYNFTFPFSWSVRFPLDKVLLVHWACLIQAPFFFGCLSLRYGPTCCVGFEYCEVLVMFFSLEIVFLPISLSHFYSGIRHARMAVIAGIRPSITTNATIIEMMAAMLFLAFVRCVCGQSGFSNL